MEKRKPGNAINFGLGVSKVTKMAAVGQKKIGLKVIEGCLHGVRPIYTYLLYFFLYSSAQFANL